MKIKRKDFLKIAYQAECWRQHCAEYSALTQRVLGLQLAHYTFEEVAMAVLKNGSIPVQHAGPLATVLMMRTGRGKMKLDEAIARITNKPLTVVPL